MPLYRLFLEDGTDAGEGSYADWLKPGDEIHVHGPNKAVVVDVVPTTEHDDDRYGGLLMIRPEPNSDKKVDVNVTSSCPWRRRATRATAALSVAGGSLMMMSSRRSLPGRVMGATQAAASRSANCVSLSARLVRTGNAGRG